MYHGGSPEGQELYAGRVEQELFHRGHGHHQFSKKPALTYYFFDSPE